MFQRLLERLAKKLSRSNIPYMVIGGQAVLLYGEPRFTRDIDITLGRNIDAFDTIIKIARALNLTPLVRKEYEFVKKTLVLPLIEKKSGIRIDFIFSFSPYEKEAILRARKVKLGKTVINFASLEDVIIHKIISGRPRDIEDIKTILLKNKKYDIHYIKKWLKVFDTSLAANYWDMFKRCQRASL